MVDNTSSSFLWTVESATLYHLPLRTQASLAVSVAVFVGCASVRLAQAIRRWARAPARALIAGIAILCILQLTYDFFFIYVINSLSELFVSHVTTLTDRTSHQSLGSLILPHSLSALYVYAPFFSVGPSLRLSESHHL